MTAHAILRPTRRCMTSLPSLPQRLEPDPSNPLHRTSIVDARSHVLALLSDRGLLTRPLLAALLPTTGLPLFRDIRNPAPRFPWQIRDKVEAEHKTMRYLTSNRLKLDVLPALMRQGRIVPLMPIRAQQLLDAALQDVADSSSNTDTQTDREKNNTDEWDKMSKSLAEAGQSALFASTDYLTHRFASLNTEAARDVWRRPKYSYLWTSKHDNKQNSPVSQVTLARQLRDKRNRAFNSVTLKK